MSVAEVAGQGAKKGWSLPGKGMSIVLFLLPALALYLLFVLVPVVQAIYYSLFKWNGIDPLNDFIGLGNYQKALGASFFVNAVEHNFLIVGLSLLIQIPFSLSLAVFLNQRFPGRTIFRMIFFLPYVISEIVTGILFYQLLQDTGAGVVNSVLRTFGFAGADWWGDTTLVMATLFVVISWKYFGFHMILLLAGLQGIPREIEEAALIDGCNKWQSFRHITLPLLGPTLRVSIFLSVIGALQLFDIIYATTRGGPLHASDTMAYYMFDFGMRREQMGYGSAVAVMLFALCFIFAILYNTFVLRRDTQGALTSLSE